MTFLFIFVVFFILLLIPFIPAVVELIRPRDALPLFIRMDYSKEPRYFGRSFKGILKNSVSADTSPGIREVKLSRNEKVEIASSRRIGIGENVDHILYIIGDLVSEDKARLNKEVYVTGDASIGSMNTLRAIACEGRLYLSSNVSIARWADAEGRVEAGDSCDLGINISSGNELRIGRGCKFKRLYGTPIITYSFEGLCPSNSLKKDIFENIFLGVLKGLRPFMDSGNIDRQSTIRAVSDDAWIVDKDCMTVPPLTRVEGNLIVKKDLKVRNGCDIVGSIKTYGDLTLESDVRISENVFSEGDIEIGEYSTIAGDIFSQGGITIKGKARIGSPGEIKSVIGKRRISLGPDVIIYGYVMTEGSGIVQ